MADVTPISPDNFELQNYSSSDLNLITTFDLDSSLLPSSYIELIVFDLNQNVLSEDLNYTSYKVSKTDDDFITQLTVDPAKDINNIGFYAGNYVAYYNFLLKHIGDPNLRLYISEISSDRKEIRLDSNILPSVDIIEQTNNFISFRNQQPYFVDFYLNFGGNNLIISNNVKLESSDESNPSILIKLYNPLPDNISLRDELWVVTTLNDPEAYRVDYPLETTPFENFIIVLLNLVQSLINPIKCIVFF